MDLLLILTYTAVAIAVFKIFNIPLNKWTVPTAVLGGIIFISVLIFGMNYNHPYSETTRSYFATTPIVSQVRGLVTEVNVEAHSLVNKGDILFKIDSTPFQNQVDVYKAKLKAAELQYQRALELFKRQAGSKSNVDNALSLRDSLRENLEKAQFELNNTTVYAPDDGYISQLILRPGVMVTPFPINPVLIFVHKQDYTYVGWFRQNSLLRLKPGDEAEIALDGIPGIVFQAKVKIVAPAIGEGQLLPSGIMVKANSYIEAGRVPVILTITDPRFEQYKNKMPAGAFGQSAIYTDHAHHLSIMRKVLLRMASWLNFLFPFH